MPLSVPTYDTEFTGNVPTDELETINVPACDDPTEDFTWEVCELDENNLEASEDKDDAAAEDDEEVEYEYEYEDDDEEDDDSEGDDDATDDATDDDTDDEKDDEKGDDDD